MENPSLCRETIGYVEPNARVCKNCNCFLSRKTMNFSNGEPQQICWCSYLATIFHKTKFAFYVNPEGSCPNFKKKPVRCPYYNATLCNRRKCRKAEYDDDCMEIT